MEEEEVVIKHRGRRFKRSSLQSNGPALVTPIHPPNGAPSSQFQPNEQKGKICESGQLRNSVCTCDNTL